MVTITLSSVNALVLVVLPVFTYFSLCKPRRERLNLVIAVLACFIIRGGKSVSDFEAFSV